MTALIQRIVDSLPTATGKVLIRDRSGDGALVEHIGIATNPLVSGSIGWTIVDEHRPGAVFLALGENRYLNGENASAINVDLLPASPTVIVDDTMVVRYGKLV